MNEIFDVCVDILHYWGDIVGLTYKEISEKLGCSIGTVMSRLYYARKKAKKLISTRKDFNNYASHQ